MSTYYFVEKPIEFKFINEFVDGWSNMSLFYDEETNIPKGIQVEYPDNSIDRLWFYLNEEGNVDGFCRFMANDVRILLLEISTISGIPIFDEYEDSADMISLFLRNSDNKEYLRKTPIADVE